MLKDMGIWQRLLVGLFGWVTGIRLLNNKRHISPYTPKKIASWCGDMPPCDYKACLGLVRPMDRRGVMH